MNFENERLKCRFSIPDRITVRMQLAYFSEAGLARGREMFERFWKGAAALITDWQCEAVALGADLDEIVDPTATEVIIWAGLQVKLHMDGLDSVPKN